MLRRLRIKFILVNMTIVTAMLCIIFTLLYYSTSRSLENESMQMMMSMAHNPMQMRPWDAQHRGVQHKNVRLPYFNILLNREGRIIDVGGDYFDLSDDEFMEELLRAVFDTQSQSGVLQEYNLRFYCTDTPRGQTIIFADMTSERSTLTNLVKNFALTGTSAFLVFLAISVLLARWAVKPVEQAWRQQKQFVADAAHELKTPLTVIMTNAELLNAPESEEKERQQFTDSILIMSKQMRGLIEKMLELARIDNGSVRAEFAAVSFSETVSDALLPFEPLFFEQDMTLSGEIEPDITVHGSSTHLKQMVDILIDNAQKYATAGANTIIRLGKIPHNRCRLEVSNQGEPIDHEELTNIFKRFYRVDKARTMNHSYGLGLSIAQRIAEEHHGRIWAESKDGYNSFYVELPMLK